MPMTDQPGWLGAAWHELGQKEVAGRGTNTRIAGFFRDAGHPQIKDDETAWCAAFLGAVLERAGIRSTRSLRARSYLAWGETLETARLGAVAVLSRGSNPALGHVGFVVGETHDEIVLLGGNQSNAVTVAAFDRSRLLALRWPATSGSGDVDDPVELDAVPDDAVFEAALAHVLRMEGGYSDDPYDPGGPTNFGITLRTYAAHVGRTLDAASHAGLKAELLSIRPEVVRTIYEQRYWRPAQCDELPPGLSLFHFDAAVNHGVGTAIRSLQEALGVDADGEIGPLTRRALREAAVPDVIARYALIRERRYRALKHFWRFGRGWLNRVAATKTAALRQAAEGPARAVPLPQPQNDGDDAMTTQTDPAATKWWGHSMTVWGALVTAAAAILPAFGPLLGLEITSEFVRQVGADIGAIVQAVAGVIGTLMTLYGRARATAPLMRREMNVRL
jgi:uncharacterized protein (TIGR02594 family)